MSAIEKLRESNKAKKKRKKEWSLSRSKDYYKEKEAKATRYPEGCYQPPKNVEDIFIGKSDHSEWLSKTPTN